MVKRIFDIVNPNNIFISIRFLNISRFFLRRCIRLHMIFPSKGHLNWLRLLFLFHQTLWFPFQRFFQKFKIPKPTSFASKSSEVIYAFNQFNGLYPKLFWKNCSSFISFWYPIFGLFEDFFFCILSKFKLLYWF